MSEKHRADCRACGRTGTDDCDLSFICSSCLRERNVCTFLPGGFKAYATIGEDGEAECSICEEVRKTDSEFVDKWHRKLKEAE